MRAAAGFQAVPSGTASDWAAEGMRPTACGLVGCSSLGWSVHDRHKGYKVFPGVPPHSGVRALDGAVNFAAACLYSLASILHLPPSTFQHNLQSACLRIVHTAASNSTISPPRFRSTTRCWTSMITKRGLLRMHRVVGEVGLLLDKETNERWEGTVTGGLVAALSMILPREEQDNDDIHPPWPIHELPDPLV